jgi:hypothetical protein
MPRQRAPEEPGPATFEEGGFSARDLQRTVQPEATGSVDDLDGLELAGESPGDVTFR